MIIHLVMIWLVLNELVLIAYLWRAYDIWGRERVFRLKPIPVVDRKPRLRETHEA